MLTAYPMKERALDPSPPIPFWKAALEVFVCTLGFCAILFSVLFCCWCVLVVLA